MIAQNNVTHMLVGKDLNILGAGSTRSALATGQIGVFEVGSKVSTASAMTSSRFTIVTKNSKGVLVETPVIDGATIKAVAVDYAAPSQRVRAVGFNGTSGSIDEQDSTDYVMHIIWKDNSCTFGVVPNVKFSAYQSSASATQAEIASGLAKNFNKNFAREVPKLIKAEVLISNAGVATSGGVGTWVNGSKYVKIVESAGSAGDAGKYNSDGATIVAGDYIRFGTALTDPCYKVAAITGGGTAAATLTLDTPFQGTSVANKAAAAMEVIAAADAATSDAGILLSALATTDGFVPGVIRYDFTEFEVELGQYFGSTTSSSVTNPSRGSGTYYEVAQNEWFLKGNRGEAWRVGSYPKDIALEATPSATYNQISISYVNSNAKTIDRSVNSYGNVLIATVSPVTGGIYAALKTVLGI